MKNPKMKINLILMNVSLFGPRIRELLQRMNTVILKTKAIRDVIKGKQRNLSSKRKS